MMSSTPASHLVHDELSPTPEMAADCRALSANLRLARVTRALSQPSPSILFENFPSDVPKREIKVSEAASRVANALHLHLD